MLQKKLTYLVVLQNCDAANRTVTQEAARGEAKNRISTDLNLVRLDKPLIKYNGNNAICSMLFHKLKESQSGF